MDVPDCGLIGAELTDGDGCNTALLCGNRLKASIETGGMYCERIAVIGVGTEVRIGLPTGEVASKTSPS